MPNRVSVIVPAYNKDSEVFQVVSNYVQELKSRNYDWEIIVVDDASRDKTLREAIRSKKFNGNTKRIKVYSYNLNQGKGFALFYGFKKSAGDTIVFADSDLDLPSHNIPKIINLFEKTQADIVIGSKRHPQSKVNYPTRRRILSFIYYVLVKILFNLDIKDTQVGLKVFKREVLADCFPRILVKKFAFDLEMLVVAKLLKYDKIIEAPVVLNYNFTSTITFEGIYKILNDTFAIFYRKNILKFYQTAHHSLSKDETFINPFEAYA